MLTEEENRQLNRFLTILMPTRLASASCERQTIFSACYGDQWAAVLALVTVIMFVVTSCVSRQFCGCEYSAREVTIFLAMVGANLAGSGLKGVVDLRLRRR